eukprot:NODE_97_length_20652_cov_0.832093.p5 type:complete len:382 gc:universal NODE_97_length_20652_cov_0.832093:14907-13762(-)
MTISTWSYTFLSLPTSPGYLMFNPPVKYANISCILSSEYESAMLSCTATHENAGTFSVQESEVQNYCKDSCRNAIKAFSSCMTNGGLDGALILRYFESGCVTHPTDSSKICLNERLKLLESKSADPSVLTQGSGPIACDACTRVSMQKMIENYDYLKSKPDIYGSNMPSSSIVDDAKNNIKSQCGKTYDQLELNAGGPGSSASGDDFPVWAIILLIIGSLVIGILILRFLFKRHKKKNQGSSENLINQPSYSTLSKPGNNIAQESAYYNPYTSQHTSVAADNYYRDSYNSQPTYIGSSSDGYSNPQPMVENQQYGHNPNSFPPHQNVEANRDSFVNAPTPNPSNPVNPVHQDGYHQNVPNGSQNGYEDQIYDNLRVTSFNQ